jgi:hypothetical protein
MDHASSSDESQERDGHLNNTDPIRFAGSFLGEKRHICGFFNSADEEYKVLLPFIKEGFDRGEKAFHVVDPKLRDDHVQRLKSIGIDLTQAEESGQFELCDWEDAYFRDGHFDQNRMLAMWEEVLGTAGDEGFPLTRLVAHMEWALEDREGVDDLLEYEARFNLLPYHKDPVVCTYDLAKFGGDVVVDIMRTHPMIIIGGILQENPFFVPPEVFLQELRQRRASPSEQDLANS